jgi:hypothetical protein
MIICSVDEHIIPLKGIPEAPSQCFLAEMISTGEITLSGKTKHTRVVSLYDRFPRNASSVSHQDVVFGGMRRNSSRTNSNILISTANVGAIGAQGKRPRAIS